MTGMMMNRACSTFRLQKGAFSRAGSRVRTGCSLTSPRSPDILSLWLLINMFKLLGQISGTELRLSRTHPAPPNWGLCN